MPILPRTIPAAALAEMTAALAAAGVPLGPLKPGARVTRTVDHHGAHWELTYLGAMGWRLTGPRAAHGVGVDAREAATRITAPPPAQTRTVHVRIGTHRRAYHPDAACPALNGHPASYRGQEVMGEQEALSRGLAACTRCDATLTAVPERYAGTPVPHLVRAAWTAPLADGWRLGVRSALAAR